jgi:hypothetical protein
MELLIVRGSRLRQADVSEVHVNIISLPLSPSLARPTLLAGTSFLVASWKITPKTAAADPDTTWTRLGHDRTRHHIVGETRCRPTSLPFHNTFLGLFSFSLSMDHLARLHLVKSLDRSLIPFSDLCIRDFDFASVRTVLDIYLGPLLATYTSPMMPLYNSPVARLLRGPSETRCILQPINY